MIHLIAALETEKLAHKFMKLPIHSTKYYDSKVMNKNSFNQAQRKGKLRIWGLLLPEARFPLNGNAFNQTESSIFLRLSCSLELTSWKWYFTIHPFLIVNKHQTQINNSLDCCPWRLYLLRTNSWSYQYIVRWYRGYEQKFIRSSTEERRIKNWGCEV